MKVKRQKRVAKILKYFHLNFGFRKPWNLLVDGTFCVACLQNKVNIKEQMPKYLEEVKLITTGCCITEMESIGSPELYGATLILKGIPLFRCDHKKAVSASACIKSLIGAGNQNHLIIASQDHNFRSELRGVAGIPLLYLHGNAPTLEKPSEMSESLTTRIADGKTNLSQHQQKILTELKKQTFGEPEPDEKKRKKRKGPKGPNPLSCKKSKKPKVQHLNATSEQSKKKRRKKKKNKGGGGENIENIES
eukprot:TRINITY_DN5172_c0_g1_i8.p1 TRINITY_DN5172_c0_g1~~TRINITY_DN5172_c0_g1_i8.p1  ORF type:complete len:249 (+),score=53.45 TRINITY_DN5172_c0_g1_i8:79-825(+)